MASARTTKKPAAPQGDGGKRLNRTFFNLSTGFDMHFFVLLMIILIVGLATLYSASHVYAFEYNGDSYYYISRQLIFALIHGSLLSSWIKQDPEDLHLAKESLREILDK